MSEMSPTLPGVNWSEFADDELSPAEVGTLKVYTGEGLRARDPDRYRAVVQGLEEGIGHCALSRLLHVSTNTIQAIEEREMSRPEFREAMVARANMALGLAIKRGAEACARAFLQNDLSAVEAAKALSIISAIARPTASDGAEKKSPAGRESNDYLDVAGVDDGLSPDGLSASVGGDGVVGGEGVVGGDSDGGDGDSAGVAIIGKCTDGDFVGICDSVANSVDNSATAAASGTVAAADIEAVTVERISAGVADGGDLVGGEERPGAGGGGGGACAAPVEVKCIHSQGQS